MNPQLKKRIDAYAATLSDADKADPSKFRNGRRVISQEEMKAMECPWEPWLSADVKTT